MIRQVLRNRLLTKILRSIYLRAPTFLSTAIYSKLRSAADPRREYFESVFESLAASDNDGDYLEFGVYQGSSFIMASQLAQKHRLNTMRFFAFDSFDGLPAAEGTAFRQGDYRCSRDLFTRIVKKGGVDMGRVEIIEGFYRDTLTNPVNRNYGLKKAAVVNVDCDLYSSAKEVLAFVEDLLHPGSIIIFDDWHAFDGMGESNTKERLGERRAFEEWSLNHCFEEFYDFVNGKAFLMLRRP